MKIIYETGDLLKCTEAHILHSCNDRGVMGSGIAKALRDEYPEVFTEYRVIFEKNGLALGDVIVVPTPDQKIVYNLIGQRGFGRDGKVYVDYDAIRTGLQKVNEMGFDPVAMPKIGAGLGGGDWKIIEAIIEEEFTNRQPIVYVV
jgi:O-acetyl-ADP-ribose deacetylase (regulator of RNase III)